MVNGLRIEKLFLDSLRADLAREIPPALDTFERVGFLFLNLNASGEFVPFAYRPLEDSQYLVRGESVGVKYSGEAIHEAINHIRSSESAFFTVHTHFGFGVPVPSSTDLKTEAMLVDCFLKVRIRPHGSVILSNDSILLRYWDLKEQRITDLCQKNIIYEELI